MYVGIGFAGVVIPLGCLMAVLYVLKAKIAGKRERMDPQAPRQASGGEVPMTTMTTARTVRGPTDSPASATIGPSDVGLSVGQPVVGTAVAPTGGAWGARFDTNTGQPIPKFDPATGKQNWDDARVDL